MPIQTQFPITFNSRNSVTPWYLAAGTTPVAAYQAIGALDYTASRVNLVNPGAADLVQLNQAPTWSRDVGWTNNGDTGQVLQGVVANLNTHSMMVRFSNLAGDSSLAGWFTTARFGLFPRPSIPLVTFRYGNADLNKTATITSGTLAISGGKCYINGVDQGLSATLSDVQAAIGVLGLLFNGSPASPLNGSVQAVLVDDEAWTPTQVATLHTTMIALTQNSTPVGGVQTQNIGNLRTATITASSAPLDWNGRVAVERIGHIAVVMYRNAQTHTSTTNSTLHISFYNMDTQSWSQENKALDGSAVTGFPMTPTASAAGEEAGEPVLITAPNGDLLLLFPCMQYGVQSHGTQQSRSTDGGKTWSSPAPITFAGLSGADNLLAYSADDRFVYNGVIYTAARLFVDATFTNYHTILVISADNGVTWNYVSDISTIANHVIEVGLEYIGNDTILAIHRDGNSRFTYRNYSYDMGATWTPLETILIPASGRHRLFTLAHLRGEANWWTDPNMILTGFTFVTPGRRSAVWLSNNRGQSWSHLPLYLNSTTNDGGYSDMYYDPTTSDYAVIGYAGDQDTANIIEWRFGISGLS